MITQTQESQLKGVLAMITEHEEPPVQDLIESLRLPSWFNTECCVIVMNKVHEYRFRDHRVEWMRFEDFIPIDEMIVMDKRMVYTDRAPPIQTYPKGDLFK